MKCKFCIYWSTKDPETDEKPLYPPTHGFYKCNKIKHLDSSIEWNEDYTSSQIQDASKHDLAFVEDASGYYAALVTSPDFGCIHFEKRHLQE